MQEKEENLTEDIINLPLDEVADGFPFFPEMCRLTSCGILTLGPFPFFDVGRGSREGRPKVDSGQMTSADVLGRQEEWDEHQVGHQSGQCGMEGVDHVQEPDHDPKPFIASTIP